MVARVHVIGAGPAGSAAALAACGEGAAVSVAEKSRLPRHKVCGEFLSPGIRGALERLGVWKEFLKLGPAPIRRFVLHIGGTEKRGVFSECGWGVSRYAIDNFLHARAIAAGAAIMPGAEGARLVVATGRKTVQPRGGRLFGFKAHFAGPADDAVEMFFSREWYAGVSPIEGGLTNVCGIAPEELLAARGFRFDELVRGAAPMAKRLAPLSRRMEWIASGPVTFAPPSAVSRPGEYRAGDALAFIDPFTGTGILNALLTGRLAGIAAARGTAESRYLADCRRLLSIPFRFASLIRGVLDGRHAADLARIVPARLLFRLTRPR